MLFILSPVMH